MISHPGIELPTILFSLGTFALSTCSLGSFRTNHKFKFRIHLSSQSQTLLFTWICAYEVRWMELKPSLEKPSICNIVIFKSNIVSNWHGIPMHHNKSYLYYVCTCWKAQHFIDRWSKTNTKTWCWGGGHSHNHYAIVVQHFEMLVFCGVLVIALSMSCIVGIVSYKSLNLLMIQLTRIV